MPVIHVEMWKGASKEVKARVAKAFTEALKEIAGKPRSTIHVIFTDVEKEDWAIGGELCSDIDWEKKSKGHS